jgi:hypothetical protein
MSPTDPFDDEADNLPLTKSEWAQTWAVLAIAVVLFTLSVAFAPWLKP